MPYIGKSPHFGVRNRFIYTATGDETSKSGADDNGATLTFTDGAYVDVYLNGVLLKPDTDYVTTTANTIGSLSALSTSDILEVIVYDVFSVSDTVSAASGGTFSAGVNIDGGVVINESSANVDFRVESNGNANMLVVDGGEDMVFIGKNAVHEFDAYGNEIMMQLESVGTAPYAGFGMVQNSNDTDSAVLIFGKSRGTSAASTTIVQSGDTLGRIEFQGMDGADLETCAIIKGECDGTPGANDMPGRLSFWTTADGAHSATERMRIDKDGNVTTPVSASMTAHKDGNAIVTSEDTVEGWSEMFDEGSNFNATTGIYTCPVAGKYYLHVATVTDTNLTDATGDGFAANMHFSVNDSGNDTYHYAYHQKSTSIRHDMMNWSTILELSANDNIRIKATNCIVYGGRNSVWNIHLLG